MIPTRTVGSVATSAPVHVASADMGERPASVKEDDGRKLRRETVEHYLETIFYIAHEGDVVRPAGSRNGRGERPHRLRDAQPPRARRLDLDGQGPERHDDRTRRDAGGAVVRHHRLLERWLTDSLGLDRLGEPTRRRSGSPPASPTRWRTDWPPISATRRRVRTAT